MSQVIMFFLFPIGLYFYIYFERRGRPAYEKIFTDFEADVQENEKHSQNQKLGTFKEMLMNNGYTIVAHSEDKVIGEKKIFSMSLFAMSVGFYYIGAVVYLLYFYYLQSPHSVTMSLNRARE